MSTTLTLRLSDSLAKLLAQRAKMRKMPKSQLARKALEIFLQADSEVKKLSPYERSKDLLDEARRLGGEGLPIIVAENQSEYIRQLILKKHERNR